LDFISLIKLVRVWRINRLISMTKLKTEFKIVSLLILVATHLPTVVFLNHDRAPGGLFLALAREIQL